MRCLGFRGTPHNRNDLSKADVVVNGLQDIVLEQLREQLGLQL
jgi:hypothetical protein